MLPDTITVNTGSPATDKLFSGIQRDGNSVSYARDSPQGDLTGVWNLSYKADVSRNGIVRSLSKTTAPYYNSTTGKYEGTVIINTTITREGAIPTIYVDQVYEGHLEANLQAPVRAAVVAARH